MIAKIWKKFLLAICVIAILFNVTAKLVNRISLEKTISSSPEGVNIKEMLNITNEKSTTNYYNNSDTYYNIDNSENLENFEQEENVNEEQEETRLNKNGIMDILTDTSRYDDLLN